MPKIPVDTGSLPTQFEPLDEGLTYSVVVRGLTLEGPDKNGDNYLSGRYEVLQPEEWRGRNIFDNYIGLPHELLPTMGDVERRRALEKGVRLGQFAKCFKVPSDPDGFDTEACLGLEGEVTVRNEEYPENSGRITSRVGEYLI